MAASDPVAPRAAAAQDELASLYAMSVELASLHELPQVLDTTLTFCLELTSSTSGFVGLLNGSAVMDVAAIKGFSPADPSFYDRYRAIPIHSTVFGVVILEGRPRLSNDVSDDLVSRGHPRGHPPVQTFLGVPLLLRGEIIGMLGVASVSVSPASCTTASSRRSSRWACGAARCSKGQSGSSAARSKSCER